MERIRKAIEKARHERVETTPLKPVRSPLATARDTAPRIDDVNERWSALPAFAPDPRTVRRGRIVTIEQEDPAFLSFDKLRTKLLTTLRQNNWTSVGVTSATPECGKTVLAVNLAFSLSRQPETRTVLVDLDLRRPAIANLLRVETGHSVATVMAGKASWKDHMVRFGGNLAIATNNLTVKASAELLQTRRAARAFEQLRETYQPDVIIADLPPMLSTDDVMSFLPNVDCMLLVAAAGASTIDQVDDCERQLAEQSHVAGVVLNKYRYGQDEDSYYY
ncbi:MAG: CpsD/CapB family tyrosine-protein kinase [Paracoccaceae bacterium]